MKSNHKILLASTNPKIGLQVHDFYLLAFIFYLLSFNFYLLYDNAG